MKRRDFLKTGSLTAGLLSLGDFSKLAAESTVPQPQDEQTPGSIPKRPYGKTSDKLSIIGFGGIVVRDTEPKDAARIVAEAFERGVNYFDVAPAYGNAEIILGPALKPYRKKVFLSCKTGRRDYEGAKAEFERSLERLETDHFDLYQLHAITDIEKDVQAAFADDGVMKLLLEAKKEGRIRYLGFSAHSQEAALEALNRYAFDSVMFPVNFAGALKGQFCPEVLKACKDRNIAVIALKILARQLADREDPVRKEYPKCWYQPITDPTEALPAMAFTLSQQPVTTAIPPGDVRLFRMALDLLDKVKPVTDSQLIRLRLLAETLNPIFSVRK